ncbi:MAG: hypothetical protein SH820_03740 [Xanthomonadales bacterium]|nr:hypothetical protein [Xanthomonadales bacterium]
MQSFPNSAAPMFLRKAMLLQPQTLGVDIHHLMWQQHGLKPMEP